MSVCVYFLTKKSGNELRNKNKTNFFYVGKKVSVVFLARKKKKNRGGIVCVCVCACVCVWGGSPRSFRTRPFASHDIIPPPTHPPTRDFRQPDFLPLPRIL